MERRKHINHEPGAAAAASVDVGSDVPEMAPEAANNDVPDVGPNLRSIEGGADAAAEKKEVREIPGKEALQTELHVRFRTRSARKRIESLTSRRVRDDRPAADRANEALRLFWPLYKEAGVVRGDMSVEEIDALREELVVAGDDPKAIQAEAARRLETAKRRIREKAGIGRHERDSLKEMQLVAKVQAVEVSKDIAGYLERSARRWQKKEPTAVEVRRGLKGALRDSLRAAVTAGASPKKVGRMFGAFMREADKVDSAPALNAFLREKIASALGYVDENLFKGVPEQEQLVDDLKNEWQQWNKEEREMSTEEQEAWAEAEFNVGAGANPRPPRAIRRGPQRKRLEAKRARRRVQQEAREVETRGRVLDQLFEMHNELRGVVRFASSEDGAEMTDAEVVQSTNGLLNKALGIARNAGLTTAEIEALRKDVFLDTDADRANAFAAGERGVRTIQQKISEKAGLRASDMEAFMERQAQRSETKESAADAEEVESVADTGEYAEVGDNAFAEYGAGEEEMVRDTHPYAVDMHDGDVNLWEATAGEVSAAAAADGEVYASDLPVLFTGELESAPADAMTEEELEVLEAEVFAPKSIHDRTPDSNAPVIDIESGSDPIQPEVIAAEDAAKEYPGMFSDSVESILGKRPTPDTEPIDVEAKGSYEFADKDPRFGQLQFELGKDAAEEGVRAYMNSKSMTREEAINALKSEGHISEMDDGTLFGHVSPLRVHEEFKDRYPDDYKDYAGAEQTRIYTDPTQDDPAMLRLGRSMKKHADPVGKELRAGRTFSDKEKNGFRTLMEMTFDKFVAKYPEKAAAYENVHPGIAEALSRSRGEKQPSDMPDWMWPRKGDKTDPALDPDADQIPDARQILLESAMEEAEKAEEGEETIETINWDAEPDPNLARGDKMADVGLMGAMMYAFGRKKAGQAAGAAKKGIGRGIKSGRAWVNQPAAASGAFTLAALTEVPAAVGKFVVNLPGRALDIVDDFLGYLQGITNSFGFTFGKFRADKVPKDRGKLLMNAKEKDAFEASQKKGGGKKEKKKGGKKAA